MTTAIRETVADLLTVPMSLNVMGQITGGGIQTAGSGSARWVIDSNSIRGEDGTAVDRGAGPGITSRIGSDGSIFLGGGTGTAHLRLDGSVPIEQVIDGSGVVRAEFGNLAANGVSAGGYKMRANDASGTPIFDSDGLIAVMQVIANIDTISPVSGTTAGLTNWADVGGASITYSLSRQQTVFLLGTASCMSNPNKFGKLQFVTDGANPSTYLLWSCASPTNLTGFAPGTLFQVLTLPAGSHTSKWQWATTPTGIGNLNVNTASLYAFLLGG